VKGGKGKKSTASLVRDRYQNLTTTLKPTQPEHLQYLPFFTLILPPLLADLKHVEDVWDPGPGIVGRVHQEADDLEVPDEAHAQEKSEIFSYFLFH
jgi:hypothetical protein